MGPSGTSRLARALALSGATLAGLLASRKIAPWVSDAVDARAALKAMSASVVYFNEVRLGQFVSYLAVLAMGLFAAAAWVLFTRLLRHHASWERRAGCAMALVPLVVAAGTSLGFLILVAACLVGGALLLTPYVGPPLRDVEPTSERRLISFVICTELLAAAWALFLVLSPLDSGFLTGLSIVVLAMLTGWRLRRGQRNTALDAIASSPVLLSPLLGFVRAPSPWILILGTLIVVALRLVLDATWEGRRLPRFLASVAAPWTLASLFIVPLGLRDLPSTNHGEHEAFNLAWINSALHGKLLFADAGLVHAPLRDYFMLALLRPMGVTLEHTRIVFTAVNLIGLAMLLPLGWRLARQNLWLHSLGAYLLLMQTTARCMLHYRLMTSVGYADVIRAALPTVALFGAIDAAQLPVPKARWRCAGYGLAMGLSLLYSHEYGLCATGAVIVALIAGALLTPGGSVAQRFGRGLQTTAAFFIGTIVPPSILFVIYAGMGRGALLLKTAYESVAFFAAGVWGSHAFMINAQTAADARFLFGEFFDRVKHFDSPIIFALPVAVYVLSGVGLIARLLSGRWSARMTLILALFLYGITSYRVTIGATDIYHLLTGTPPAILLFVALVSDAASFRLGDRRRGLSFPVGVVTAGLAAIASLAFGEYSTGMVRKLGEYNSGEEKPPSLVRHSNPEIPRAGDVLIPSNIHDLITYIRNETRPTDPIFVRVGIFDGAEFYFLSDRRNPTRFDTLSEVLTKERQHELLEVLERDPPEIIIGSNTSFLGQEVCDYIDSAWSPAPPVGGYAILRRRR